MNNVESSMEQAIKDAGFSISDTMPESGNNAPQEAQPQAEQQVLAPEPSAPVEATQPQEVQQESAPVEQTVQQYVQQEQSSFNRAAKRWFGVTPNHYRKSLHTIVGAKPE